MSNPWKVDTEGWSFNPKEIAVLRPVQRRQRTFTGDIKVSRTGLLQNFTFRRKLVRMGIIAFLAADLFLVAVFIASIL